MMADAVRLMEELGPELEQNAAEAEPVAPPAYTADFEAEVTEPSVDVDASVSAIFSRLAELEAENASLKSIALDATNQLTAAVSLIPALPQNELALLEEVRTLIQQEMKDEQIRDLRLEVERFRKDVRRRESPWWKRVFGR
jgi:hypothetical protein